MSRQVNCTKESKRNLSTSVALAANLQYTKPSVSSISGGNCQGDVFNGNKPTGFDINDLIYNTV